MPLPPARYSCTHNFGHTLGALCELQKWKIIILLFNYFLSSLITPCLAGFTVKILTVDSLSIIALGIFIHSSYRSLEVLRYLV